MYPILVCASNVYFNIWYVIILIFNNFDILFPNLFPNWDFQIFFQMKSYFDLTHILCLQNTFWKGGYKFPTSAWGHMFAISTLLFYWYLIPNINLLFTRHEAVRGWPLELAAS